MAAAIAVAPESQQGTVARRATTAGSPSAELLPALTGMRFFLALWVVLHHLTGRGMMLDAWAATLPGPAYSLIRGGYLAVGSFFVLSGFVLTRRYAATRWNRKSLLRYTVSRFARIYPVYALSLLVVLPFMLMDFQPRWMANYVFLLQGWADPLPVHWNTPAWSLSCEVFFYLCFPALVLFFRTGSWGGVLAVATVACMLTATMRSLGVPEPLKPIMHFSDFLIGIAAADAYDLLTRPHTRFRLQGYWLYLPGCLLGATLIARPDLLFHRFTLNGVLRPLNALTLLGLALGGGFLVKCLSGKSVIFLGKASYSLYILHIPLLWWWKFADPVNPLPPIFSAIAYTLIVIVASAAAYHWFEEPANTRVRNRLAPR